MDMISMIKNIRLIFIVNHDYARFIINFITMAAHSYD